MTYEEAKTADQVREKLLCALSAVGAAATGLAEALRHDPPAKILAEGQAWKQGDLLPLDEEAIEPLADALRLVIEATGILPPHDRMFSAVMRYTEGDD